MKDKDTFLKAFKLNNCNISKSCEAANISRQTFYNWKEDDDDFRQEVVACEEALLDLAESKLMENINKGATPELIFYLKTKGKKRGYIERTETDISSGGEKIVISLGSGIAPNETTD